MLFSSQFFILIFLPLSVALYYAMADRYRMRLAAILIASGFFYAWWDPRFVPLLLGSVGANWLLVRAFFATGQQTFLTLGVLFNLSLLGLFKYANFLAESVLGLMGITHQPWTIILPLGISFFTFQQISYLIDVKRGEANAYGMLEYANYVSFFPQLIAGPIVRHGELIPQFSRDPFRPEITEMFGRGIVLFVLGLIKKVFFADELGAIADEGFAVATTISSADAWTAALAYSLQLYFDFSSYSDMAIGLAAMFGFVLPINFDAPYKARNIREFWRRWHITLSNFLRDYVYIPLGGSHGGLAATCIVVMITMLLCGLWHGAGWTFVAWGALHGLAICANRTWLVTGLRVPVVFGWALTMVLVVIGWVLFRAPTFSDAGSMLRSMAIPQLNASNRFDAEDWRFVALGVGFSILGPTNWELVRKSFIQSRAVAVFAALALMIVCLRVGQGRGLEFIYFQF
ncbi:MAG: MBOAT family protein [Pseudomonadota bacterium]